MDNAQTFSQDSDQYAKSRPQYPAELFTYLSGLCRAHDSAWDCATGNGQAAVTLANHFAHVEATDISAEQIEHGIAHPRVHYSVTPAEHTPFPNLTFDLITVATAVHWFDLPAFYQEVDRVLKPEGILAVWGYGFFSVEPGLHEFITSELLNPIDRFWAPGNRQVMNGYRDLALPFETITPPGFEIRVEWNLEQFISYARTWSAVKRHIIDVGYDPVSKIETTLAAHWGAPETTKIITMPLSLKVCRKPG